MKLLANFYACLAIILLIGLLKAEGRGAGYGGGGRAGGKNGLHEMEETPNHFIVRRHAPKISETDFEAPLKIDEPAQLEEPRARRSAPSPGLDEPEEPEEIKQIRGRRHISVDEPEEPEEPKHFRTRRHVSADEPEEPEEPKQIRPRRQVPDMPKPPKPDDMPKPPMPVN